MSSLFCRHNRFTAECPICSKGSVLAREATGERPKPAKPAKPRSRKSPAVSTATVTRYPHVTTEAIEHEGRIYTVRLEKVPGGLRLGEWRSGELEKRAPVLPASALRELFDEARGRGLVGFDLADPVDSAESLAASEGRAGDLKEELRLERLDDPGLVRIARWVYWPGAGVGWELQEAPVMLPEPRFKAVVDAGLI